MKNMQQHQSVELRQCALVNQVDGHRALRSCNLASDNQTHNNKSLKILQFSRAPVVTFETSTLSLDQGKSIAIFCGDHLVRIISKLTLLRDN